VFFERIKILIKIAIPSYKTKEALYIFVLTGLLVIRTYMSIWLADVNGQVVKSIVNRNFGEFVRRVSDLTS
jgi:ABC transporter transmembrane region 2